MNAIHDLPVISYGATALVPYSKEVVDLLSHKDKFGNEYKMFEHSQGQPYIRVPRGLVDRAKAEHDHTVVNHAAQSIALAPPRNDDQAHCIAKSLALLKTGQDHIVEAPTGFGKTYVGGSVSNQLEQVTLVVVTKNDLVKPWKDTFINLLGYSPSEVGHVQQDICNYKGCKVVVAMIHSLVCREYPPDFYSHFGLVIFDEVHHLGADYFVQAASMFPACFRLGLSATPKRSDGREKMFHAHIGPVMVRGNWVPMKPKILVKKTGWKVPMVSRRDPSTGTWARVPLEVVPGRMVAVLKALAKDPARNTEIATFVRAAFDAGRTTLILSDLIDGHLKPLFHYLVTAGIPGENIAFYIGSCTPAELARAKVSRVVLGTYQMVGEGTDVPVWDTIVLATPRANIKQALGRIMRHLEGKPTPTALELVDDNPMLIDFYYSRLRQYYSVGAEIIEV